MGEFLAEAIGWLLEMLAPAAAAPDASPAADAAEPTPAPRGDGLLGWATLMFGVAFAGLTVAVPILWATGAVDGLTLIGLGVAALIAGRVTQLLARYRRRRPTL